MGKPERSERPVKEERNEKAEKQEYPSEKPERPERSSRQSRRERSRNRKSMEGEIVLLDEDMEFVRLDEDDSPAGKAGDGIGEEAAQAEGKR